MSRAVQDGPGSVVVAGLAGVGKSRLVTELLARTAADGWRSVLVRATRSTASIPFGPFVSWCPSRPAGPPTDRLHVLREITAALLDDSRPVIIAVDDAYLLDESSAALVLHLAAQTRARVVVTVRADEHCPDAVVALWKEGLVDRVDLEPLAEAEVAELVGHALDGPVEPAVVQRVWCITAGTPLYVREVLHAAHAQGVLDRRDGAWRWQGELAGSDRLGELLLGRLVHLRRTERRVLDLVAVGEPLAVEVTHELGCLRTVAELERLGLVSAGGGDGDDDADGDVVRLSHPLYGELLRAGMPKLAARSHQHDLARAAVAVGWHRHDPLRVAAWWSEGLGLPGPAEVFVPAARRALMLGRWELAVQHAEVAESSGPVAEARLLKAAALVHLAGWGEAGSLPGSLSPGSLDDHMQAEHARLRAGFMSWSQGRMDAGRALLVRTAERLEAPASGRALADAAYIALVACDLDEAIRLATAAMNDAGPTADVRVAAMAVAMAALVLQGRATPALQLARTGAPHLSNAVTADPFPDNPAGVFGAAHCLAMVLDGRLGDATALAATVLAPFASSSVDVRLTITATMAGRVALLRGQPREAQRWGGEALRNAGAGPGSQWPAAVVATAAGQLGEPEAARTALDHAAATSPPLPLLSHELALAECWARAATGELTAARTAATQSAAGAAEAGVPVFEMLALLDLARLGGAASAAPRLSELTHVIEGRFARVSASYAQAVAAADGEALDQVSVELEETGALLVAAEAAAAAATAHRAAGLPRRDRASSAHAQALASRCPGAQTPGVRDLGASLSLTRLTRRQREVAELAARGLTNREIARRLDVSIRTVNAHLGHAYAMLGTSDRTRLTSLLPLGPT